MIYIYIKFFSSIFLNETNFIDFKLNSKFKHDLFIML